MSTLIGNGAPGHSDTQVNNPYGVVIGPDGALYFCDLDNQRIRRLDLATRRTRDIAGSGQRGYARRRRAGDGGLAEHAARDRVRRARPPLHRRARQPRRPQGRRAAPAGSRRWPAPASPDSRATAGRAARAELRQPHSIAIAPDGRLLICDVGNHRLRAVDLATGTIETIGGTGERRPTPDGAPLAGTPLDGPRTIAVDGDGTIYLALREGNAIHRIAPRRGTIHHLAGTGAQGYSGDGGPARLATLGGPKGLALSGRGLYVADTENHAIRRIDLDTGIITTVLGTGTRGDGPDGDPRQCALARPHGVFAGPGGVLYVGDSEAHRIRVLRG